MADPVGGDGSARAPDSDALATARLAAEAAADKLGTDTLILHVGPILALADYFVITGASNDRQVRSIVEEVEKRLKARSVRPLGTEGLAEARWVLLDFGDVVVHVFHDEARAYYSLERLWADAEHVPWGDDVSRAGAEEVAGG